MNENPAASPEPGPGAEPGAAPEHGPAPQYGSVPPSGPPPTGGPTYGHGPGDLPPTPGARPPHSGADSFFDGIRRSGLVRSDERWIGGVGGGIALRLGIDPLVVRGVLGVSVLLGGVGLVLYGLAWLLLPEQRDGRIHLQQLFRGDFDVAVLAAFAVLVTGLSFPDSWIPGLWWAGDRGWWSGLLWLSAVIVVVVLVASSSRGQRAVPPGGAPGSPRPPAPPYPGASAPTAPYATAPAPTAQYPTHPAHPAHPTAPYPAPGDATFAAAGPRRTEGPTTTLYPTPSYSPTAYPPGAAQAQRPSGPTGPLGPTGPVTAIPRPPATRGPGATAVGIVVALTLLTFAGLLYADRSGQFDGPVLLVTGATALVLAGLGIIVSGLRGRSSGALGGLSVIAIIALVPLSAVHEASWSWAGSGTAFGEVVERPRTVAAAEHGYSLGAGDARIDLTELPSTDDPIEVPVRVGAGDVRIIMPADGAYSGEIQVFAGEVDWLGESISRRGGGSPSTYESQAVTDGAEPDLVLDITVGAGRVTVVEE